MIGPILIAALSLVDAAPAPLSTIAERSGFVRTGRYDEVPRLCEAFAAAAPAKVRCASFGTTPEGRDMKVLVLSADGALDPATARARGRPVILAVGGIHAGEIDGKDAGFLVLRALLDGKLAKGVLDKVTLVFVPVFNVDGHERFGANHRPNQRGPAEMGWRTTAQNLNLNRDWTKAEAPEMQAMLRLVAAWDPAVLVDLHVTDGAKFRHDVAVVVEPAVGGPAPLQEAAQALSRGILERVDARGHHGLAFYPSFEKDDDPASGFAVGVPPPRLGTGYMAVRNRIGVLVEAHSWHDYKARVRATHDVLAAVLELALADAARWREVGIEVDRTDGGAPGEVPLTWENTDETKTIDFLGYAYSRVPSAVSGALRTIYDERKPQLWKIPLKSAVKPVTTARAPGAGYIVPAAHAAWVKEKLELHGIRAVPLDRAMTLEAQAFRATAAQFSEKPYEARMTARVQGAWRPERRAVEKGALYVPVAQPLGRLVVHLLEPTAPDSLCSWGFFNASFEQKEYMEGYVAEEVGEKMLEDPKVRAEFQALLEKDPAFARDAEKRLDFFYRRHPSWDERKDLYPILRVDLAPR
jgi:hypothetical protein